MHPLIDEKLQHKARAYEKKRDVYNGIMLFITGSYFSLVYISGFSQRISGTVTSFRLPFALAVYFFFLLLPITALIFPLSYFKDFRLEKKFDLTAQSFQSWFGDELKSLAVGTLLGFPVLLLLFYLFRYSPRHWSFSKGAYKDLWYFLYKSQFQNKKGECRSCGIMENKKGFIGGHSFAKPE
jgi:hypothetical protein